MWLLQVKGNGTNAKQRDFVKLAVSRSTDPRDAWFIYSFPGWVPWSHGVSLIGCKSHPQIGLHPQRPCTLNVQHLFRYQHHLPSMHGHDKRITWDQAQPARWIAETMHKATVGLAQHRTATAPWIFQRWALIGMLSGGCLARPAQTLIPCM